MQFDTIVNDVTTKAQTYAGQAQTAAKTSTDTLKHASGIIVDSASTIVSAHADLATKLMNEATGSFEKAKKDGVKKVASAPITYLPNGKAHVVSTYQNSVKVATKSRGELTKVLTKGFDAVQVDLGLKAAPKKTVRKASTAAKKTAASTKTAAKKTATTARKTTAKRATAAKTTVKSAAAKA